MGNLEDVLTQLIQQGLPKSEDQKQILLDKLSGKKDQDQEPEAEARPSSSRSSR